MRCVDERQNVRLASGRSVVRRWGQQDREDRHGDYEQRHDVRHRSLAGFDQLVEDPDRQRLLLPGRECVNVLDDEALVAEIKARGLGLTACPISNRYVTDGLKAREIMDLLERGVRVTVNSDDPAYFPGYMNENLIAAQESVNLTREQILHLVRNAFTISWLPRESKDHYITALEAYARASIA
jgi:hypothetical protein